MFLLLTLAGCLWQLNWVSAISGEDQLDAFIDFSQDLRAAFVAELETMTQRDSSKDVVYTEL